MTGCPRAEHFYLYLEGELGPYDARKLEEHADLCPSCRERLAERRLLHEAFTTLPPFEVPPDFARAVMDRLPEPEPTRAGWLAALVTATVSLAVGLLGFNLLTGQSLSDVLIAVNRLLGSVAARLLPLAVKLFKTASLLLKVAADLVAVNAKTLGTFLHTVEPLTIGLLFGLATLLSLLGIFGARRFLSPGERP